jgi:hypothetical protein
MRFEFCEGLFDRIEIWGIGRKAPQRCACRLDRLAHTGNLVGWKIVHHDDLAGRQRRPQALFEIGEEDFAVHWGVDHERSGHTIVAQAGDKGRHLPVAVRNLGDEPLATRAATAQPCHVGRGPGLVDEDELARIKPRLFLSPVRTRQTDVFAVLLGGVQAFF